MLIAALCAEGTSEIHNVREIDRGYERIDERLRALGRADRARRRRDPPDPQRHARRPAGRDARAARDHGGDAGRVRIAPATARSPRPRSSTRTVLTRGDPAAADPAYKLFDEHGNVLVLRSDMTIPIARVVATRYASRRAAAALLLLRPRLPLRAPAARPGARDAAGGDRAGRRARAGRHGRGAHACCARGSTPPGWRTTGSGSATPRCTGACSTALGGAGGRAAADPARARHARLRRAGARGRGARARRAAARAAAARRRRGARGDPGGRRRCAPCTTCWRPRSRSA